MKPFNFLPIMSTRVFVPLEKQEPGSLYWINTISCRLQTGWENIERYGVDGIIAHVKSLLPHKPWLVWPEDSPCGSVSKYFELVTGNELPYVLNVIESLSASEGKALRLEINKSDEAFKGDCKDYQTRQDVEEAMKKPLMDNGSNQHKDTGSYNITPCEERGTSKAYILARLARDEPGLLLDVEAGKLSARAAGIKAGFVKNTQVNITKDPSRLAGQIAERVSKEYRLRLVELLMKI